MIEESEAFLPIWMLLSAAFGFIVGEAAHAISIERSELVQMVQV